MLLFSMNSSLFFYSIEISCFDFFFFFSLNPMVSFTMFLCCLSSFQCCHHWGICSHLVDCSSFSCRIPGRAPGKTFPEFFLHVQSSLCLNASMIDINFLAVVGLLCSEANGHSMVSLCFPSQLPITTQILWLYLSPPAPIWGSWESYSLVLM